MSPIPISALSEPWQEMLRLVIALFVCAWQPSQPEDVTCDLRHSPGAIAILKVNGTNVSALIDTGASNNAVDRQFWETHLSRLKHDSVDARMISGARQLNRIRDVPCSLADFDPRTVEVLQFDEPRMREIFGDDVQSVCGMSMLQGHVISISETELRISKTPLQSGRELKEWPVLYGRAKTPKCEVVLPGQLTLDFTIDSGALAAGTIHLKVAEFLVDAGEGVIVSGPGDPESKTLVVREMIVFGQTCRNVPMVVGMQNTIGLELLQLFEATIDLQKNKILTAASPTGFEGPFRLDASGLRFIFDGNNLARVRRIVEKTPAAETDIRVGDEFVAIDDVLLKDITLLDAFRRLSVAGTTVKLDFKRDGKPYTVHLPLKRDFEYPPKWKVKEPNKEADNFFKFLQSTEDKAKP